MVYLIILGIIVWIVVLVSLEKERIRKQELSERIEKEKQIEKEQELEKIKKINNLSEDEQISLLNQSPHLIDYIKNPSRKLKLFTIMRKYNCIINIIFPNEKDKKTIYKVAMGIIKDKYDNSIKEDCYLFEQEDIIKNYIDKLPEDLQYLLIKVNSSFFKNINNPSEDIQYLVAETNHFLFKDIKNPTIKVAEVALKSAIKYHSKGYTEFYLEELERYHKHILEYLNEMSEETQQFAVEKYPLIISYIQNPSEKLQLLAIEKKSYAISYIKNPTEKAQELAVKSDPQNIRDIENPTEEVQNIAIDVTINNNSDDVYYLYNKIKNPYQSVSNKVFLHFLKENKEKSIAYHAFWRFNNNLLDKVSEKIQLLALEKEPRLIRHISNPNDKLISLVLDKQPELISYFKKVSEENQLLVVQKNPELIEYIEKPTEKVQLCAVEKDPRTIKYIKNPTDKVIKSIKNKVNPIIANLVVNPNADNYLYYFSFVFKNKKYYKIGITSISLEKRYGKEYDKIHKILYYQKVDGALKIEKQIIKEYQQHLFPLAYFSSGQTEIFDIDILGLDNE